MCITRLRVTGDQFLLAAFLAVSSVIWLEASLALRGTVPFPVSIVLVCFLLTACAVRLQGFRPVLLLMGLALAIPFASEFSGVLWGIPYGRYHYGDVAGPRVLGLVPAFMYVAWLVILFATVGTTSLAFRGASPKLAVFDGAIATGLDVMIDPLAVRAGYWTWEDPGAFYGIPLTNFLGWFVVVAVTGIVLRLKSPQYVKGFSRAPKGVAIVFPLLLCQVALRYAIEGAATGFPVATAIGLFLTMPFVALAVLSLMRRGDPRALDAASRVPVRSLSGALMEGEPEAVSEVPSGAARARVAPIVSRRVPARSRKPEGRRQ